MRLFEFVTDSIFDTTDTGSERYNDILHNLDDYSAKGVNGEIVYMPPNNAIAKMAKGQNTTPSKAISKRMKMGAKEKIEKIKQKIGVKYFAIYEDGKAVSTVASLPTKVEFAPSAPAPQP